MECMEKNTGLLELVLSHEMPDYQMTDKEKEIALKILDSLEGNLIIRATLILELCLKSLQYYRVKK